MLDGYKEHPEKQPPRLVQLDTRGRLSLQKYTAWDFFQLTVEADGTIVLCPATVYPRHDGTVVRGPVAA